MVKFSLPRNTATPVKFLGYFTVKDIARLAVPTTISAGFTYNPVDLVGTLLGVLAGLVIGLALVFLQIEGETVDVHFFHFLRQRLVEKFSDLVEIDRVSDEYVLTSTGTAVGVVKVQPVPLSMQGEAQQKALHSTLAELYDTVSFPIEVHSRQLPLKLDTYIEKITDSEETVHLQDYTQYLENLNQGNATTTHHYIVVRADKPGETQFREILQNIREHYERLEPAFEKIEHYIKLDPEKETDNSETVAKLNHRLDVVVDQLNRGSLEATQITGLELQQYANSFNQQPSHNTQTYQLPDSQIGAYRRPLHITEYPANAELGWPVTLLNQSSNGRIDIIQRIKPRNQSKTVRKLERHIDRLDAEINSRLGGGLIKDIAELRTRREDAENMVSLAADNNQSLIDYSTYIIAHGDTPQQRDHAHTQVKTRLDTLLAEYQSPVFRTDQAVKTESILHNDPLNQSRIMPSSSAASGFTFATTNQNEGSGIIYGTSTEDQSPVLLQKYRQLQLSENYSYSTDNIVDRNSREIQRILGRLELEPIRGPYTEAETLNSRLSEAAVNNLEQHPYGRTALKFVNEGDQSLKRNLHHAALSCYIQSIEWTILLYKKQIDDEDLVAKQRNGKIGPVYFSDLTEILEEDSPASQKTISKLNNLNQAERRWMAHHKSGELQRQDVENVRSTLIRLSEELF